MAVSWTRIKAKSLRQLIRLAFTRVWPLSILGRIYYRYHYSRGHYLRVNQHAVRLFSKQPNRQAGTQAGIVDRLRHEGVVTTHMNNVIPEISARKLSIHAENLLRKPNCQLKIKNRINTDDAKWYVVRGLGAGKNIELPWWIAEVVLHPNILTIANEYLGLFSRLNYVDVWHNFPVLSHEPCEDSEFWHRDHEDTRIFKFFLYLCDVDKHTGPHQYLRRTHPQGEYYGPFPQSPPIGIRLSDSKINKAFPRRLQTVCTGPLGTLVMEDPVGFHRGGRCSESPRILLVATYTSNLAVDCNTYRLSCPTQYEALDAAGKYAIRAGEE